MTLNKASMPCHMSDGLQKPPDSTSSPKFDYKDLVFTSTNLPSGLAI